MYLLDSIGEILQRFPSIMTRKNHLDTGDVFQEYRTGSVFVFEGHFEMRLELLYVESLENAVELGHDSLVAYAMLFQAPVGVGFADIGVYLTVWGGALDWSFVMKLGNFISPYTSSITRGSKQTTFITHV